MPVKNQTLIQNLINAAAQSAGETECTEAIERPLCFDLIFQICDDEVSKGIDRLYDASHNIHKLEGYDLQKFRTYVYTAFIRELVDTSEQEQRSAARKALLNYLRDCTDFDHKAALDILQVTDE